MTEEHMHEEPEASQVPIHSATSGPITIRVYRGNRPPGRAGLYECFKDREGYYVMAGKTDATGQFNPATVQELEPEDYSDWEAALDECFWFITAELRDPNAPAQPPAELRDPNLLAQPHGGRIAFDSEDQRRFCQALDILREGGDVRSNFLHDATKVLIEAAQVVSSERFVYAAGLRELSAADWAAMVMVIHAATFACRLADIVGEEAQDHVDGWLRDTIPVLSRIVGDEGAPK